MPEFTVSEDTMLFSPSRGNLTLSEVAERIVEYIKAEDKEYEIAVGTDSMTYDKTQFALAITVHRLNTGGIYFYKKFYSEKFEKFQLFEKLYFETDISLQTSRILLDAMAEKGIDIENSQHKVRFIVHVDVGNYGRTKDYIQALVGMVHSYGYDCEIKPNSYAASSIADKLSK